MVEQQILRTGHEGTASNNYRSGKLAFRRNATEVIINKYNIIGYRTANFTLLPILMVNHFCVLDWYANITKTCSRLYVEPSR